MPRGLALVLLLAAALAHGGEPRVSLRLGGSEVALTEATHARLETLSREMLSRCGPNTLQHPHNFGLAAPTAVERHTRTLAGSRLHVVFSKPFVSESHLGGALGVSEAVIGLEDEALFVGPSFTRHGGAVAEHLQCEYLPALELACLPQLAPHLPARYRETCALLERGTDGRIVMPPPDIAPSCS
jgi:hypothetical protein